MGFLGPKWSPYVAEVLYVVCCTPLLLFVVVVVVSKNIWLYTPSRENMDMYSRRNIVGNRNCALNYFLTLFAFVKQKMCPKPFSDSHLQWPHGHWTHSSNQGNGARQGPTHGFDFSTPRPPTAGHLRRA